jgi:protein-disulfide isomerase
VAKQSTPDPDRSGQSKAAQRAARAAQANAEMAARKRKAQMRRAGLYSVGLVALVALVVVLVFVGKDKSNDTATDPSSGGSDGTSSTGGLPAIGQTKYGLTVGDPSAPHQVIVYEDFICPYCGAFEAASHDDLAKAAAAGKVYIDYRPFHLLPEDYSSQAASAFFAVKDLAGDTVAKQFHDVLYAKQPSEQGPYPSIDDIVTEANTVVPAADQAKVDDAIRNGTYDSWVPEATDQAEKDAGVNGTPTVYFDGKVYNDVSGTATGTFGGMQNMATNLVKAVQ